MALHAYCIVYCISSNSGERGPFASHVLPQILLLSVHAVQKQPNKQKHLFVLMYYIQNRFHLDLEVSDPDLIVFLNISFILYCEH